MTTIRYATYDNFRCLLATDNYLEKYLPFRVQAMVSASILSYLPNHKAVQDEKDSTGKYLQYTAQEMNEIRQFAYFKSHEQRVFKELHSHVLSDDGLPTIKKSAFKMPGYRAVAAEIEVDIKHSLDEQQFDEIKERDSEEEDLKSQKVEIVSYSGSSDRSG